MFSYQKRFFRAREFVDFMLSDFADNDEVKNLMFTVNSSQLTVKKLSTGN